MGNSPLYLEPDAAEVHWIEVLVFVEAGAGGETKKGEGTKHGCWNCVCAKEWGRLSWTIVATLVYVGPHLCELSPGHLLQPHSCARVDQGMLY